MMRSLAVAIALLILPGSARAQGMGAMGGDAMGQPLADGSLPVGTATVRVVRGSFLAPVVDAEVNLVGGADETRRVARSDGEGRATFAGLKPGNEYVATVVDDGKESSSMPFVVPAQGGLRLALTTIPWRSAGHGDKQQSSSPDKMSGIPQELDSLTPRIIAVRVIAGEWRKSAGKLPIHLVAFHGDGSVDITSRESAEDGRVTFAKLEPRGVAYYVLASLKRPAGIDRLQSRPITLAASAGTSLLLAGKAIDDDQVVDLLGRLYEDQLPAPRGAEPGEVVVRLAGRASETRGISEAELIVIGDEARVAKTALAPQPAPPSTVRGQVLRAMAIKKPAGTLAVSVIRGRGSKPLAGIPVELLAGTESLASTETAADGLVEFADLEVGREYTVAATVRGKRITAGPMALPADSGVMIPLAVDWAPDQLVGQFKNVAWNDGLVYVARVRSGDRYHLSPPFQMTPTLGATVTIPVATKPEVRFSIAGSLDNDLIRFQGMFFIHNDSFAPYDPGPKGFAIPLPRGFVAAGVSDGDDSPAKVERDVGFVYRTSLPPGGAEFHGGFGILTKDGELDFDLALPHGASRSNLRLVYIDGIDVSLSGNVDGEVVVDPRSGQRLYEVADINIAAGERLVMRVSNLPHLPSWRRLARLAAGLIVLGLLLWAAVACFLPRKRAAGGRPDQREALLAELTELERRHRAGNLAGARYQRSRSKLLAELEQIYRTNGASPAR